MTYVFFFKQKTAYEMRISDWSSDVCSSDLLNLPDMHGYDVLKKLRAAKVNTPILILSGMGEADKKVKGLGFGADDYLTKPFNKDALVARITAIVSPAKGHSQSDIPIHKWTDNLDAKSVVGRVCRLPLTVKQYHKQDDITIQQATNTDR